MANYQYHSIVLHRDTDAEVKKLIYKRRAAQTRGREFSFNRLVGEAVDLWIKAERLKNAEAWAKRRAKKSQREAEHETVQKQARA